jgi:hypothetical protein
MNEELNTAFWNVVNEIEHQNTRLNSCQSIVAICAERALGDDSGALWAASDILKDIESKMDERVQTLLSVYRQIKEVPSPKGKRYDV